MGISSGSTEAPMMLLASCSNPDHLAEMIAQQRWQIQEAMALPIEMLLRPAQTLELWRLMFEQRFVHMLLLEIEI